MSKSMSDSNSLLSALKRRQLKQAKALLEAGADPEESSDQSSDFPLKVAAERGFVEILPLLVAAGAEVDRPGYNGTTPLAAACLRGHLQNVKTLLHVGAELERGDDFGYTPLFWAVVGGHLELVRYLVAQGASFLRAGQRGDTPLYRAVSSCSHPQSPEILAFFLEQGADPNHRGPHGTSLLMAAALDGRLESVDVLLKAGADMRACTDRGEQIMHLLCRSSKEHPAVVERLLRAGAELNRPDAEGCGILQRAAQRGLLATVQLLLQAGLSPEHSPASKFPPALLMAIRANHPAVAEALLQAGAEPEADSKSDFGAAGQETTPLMEALARRQYELARDLIARGASLQARDRYGTVLMYALGIQDAYLYERLVPPKISTPFLRWLLKQDLPLDSEGYASSPEQLAKGKGLKQIGQMLQKRQNSR